ncbi:hypothetical protein [Burkholderia vietnamiensis]|uniref:hypothetical protein n=1 Tax=Burkholderia vietnamiensis TaxID=60552 RepID=UPI001D15201F|nr:hypothetical protein [Burkholderia vietnamiensis]UEC02585.1 hypothetical protein LK462_11435 [Burkholderia vietnamiensis]
MPLVTKFLRLIGLMPGPTIAARGIVGSEPESASVARSPSTEPAKRARLPSKFDDLLDFGLAKHSPNTLWSVGYWDPGPDPSLQRQRTVRLRDNTTGKIVAVLNTLERPFAVDVADTGVFGVHDAGQASELSSKLIVFDVTGAQLYERAYRANLFGFGISSCGRYVASQTCNSGNEDSNLFEVHDVAQRRVLASCAPVAGWSSEYTFETEGGELKRVVARINHLGKFAYSPTGAFLDAKKFMTARLSKGDPWTRIRAAGELVQTDGSATALKRAFDVVDATISAFKPGEDARWLAGGYRLKGELLERMNMSVAAIEAYRAALGLDAKIGVKKRLTALEKGLANGTSLGKGTE